MIIKIFDLFDEELSNIWTICKSDSNSTLFQDYYWMLNWYNCFGDFFNTKLSIAVLYKKNKAICILPLCINTKKNIKFLEWIGSGVSDYLLPIVKDLNKIEKFEYELIFKKILFENPDIDIIHLTNQPEIISQSDNLFINYFKSEVISTSYQIYIETEWKEFIKINKSIKRQYNDLIRLEKNLNNFGSFRFIEHFSIEERMLATREMIYLKEKQYNLTGVKNIFKNKLFKDFYLGLAKCKEFSKYIHISSITVNNKLISVHYGLRDTNCYYYLMPAFRQGWKKYSPGAILMSKLIQLSFKQDLNEFDFLPGNEAYKVKWSNKKLNIYEYNKPITIKGYLYFVILRIRNYLRKSIIIKKIIYFSIRNYNTFLK